MSIDINANIGHWPFQQTNCNSCRALLERMERYGVELSVISNMNGIFYKNTQSSNEELHEEMMSDRRFRNRFVPFGIINPIYAGWKRDLEICATKMGFKGIRLYPLYHDYEITDDACIELVKLARDRGLIIAFTLRMVDSRLRSWMDINKEWSLKDVLPIIREVPDAKYLVLNISGGAQLNSDDTELIRKTNILLDTSGRNMNNFGELIGKYGKEKFAFGTHSPILDYLTGLLRIEALRENEADKQTRELIRSGNAKRMLGIL
jgi:uncharacterized protein